MRYLIRAVHDIWCAVTARCRVTAHYDPILDDLRAHEVEAWRHVGKLRAERQERHALVRAMYHDWDGGGDD